MVQAIASGGPTPAAGYPGPYEIHLLQFGDTFESLAERFDIVDPATLAVFRELNPELALGRALPGAAVRVPVRARRGGAATLQPTLASRQSATVETAWTNGFGRRIERQNDFNSEIDSAKVRWPELDPLVFKSILAQESGFNPNAANAYGFAGIAQMGIGEARAAGLATGASRMGNSRLKRPASFDRRRDERFVARREIPAAASLLRNKARALDRGIVANGRSLHGFDFYGRPAGDDFWRFASAAYNAGEGTVLAALNIAYHGHPPETVRWDDLVRSPDGIASRSPLWRALRSNGLNPVVKYREVTEYADNVVRRARQ